MERTSLEQQRGTSMIYNTETLETIRPLSNDERRAVWAAAFYGAGWHRGRATPDEINGNPPGEPSKLNTESMDRDTGSKGCDCLVEHLQSLSANVGYRTDGYIPLTYCRDIQRD